MMPVNIYIDAVNQIYTHERYKRHLSNYGFILIFSGPISIRNYSANRLIRHQTKVSPQLMFVRPMTKCMHGSLTVSQILNTPLTNDHTVQGVPSARRLGLA